MAIPTERHGPLKPPSGVGLHAAIGWRLAVVGVLLPLELLALTLTFDGEHLAGLHTWWSSWIINARSVPQLLVVAAGALLTLSADRLPNIERDFVAAFRANSRWPYWLAAHLVGFLLLFALTRAVFDGSSASALTGVSWMTVAAATLVLWLVTMAPPHFWASEAVANKRIVAIAATAGTAAWIAGRLVTKLWEPFAAAAFYVSAALLRLVYPNVESSLADKSLNVDGFGVLISAECSGLEGVGLVLVFLAAYFWIFRDRHRFPRSLLLFPVAAATIWIFNAVRIAALVVIGAEVSPAIAVQGFHSQAGWIAFTLVTVGIVTFAGRMPFFLKEIPDVSTEPVSTTPSYLVPVLAVLATSLVTGAFIGDWNWLYPLSIAAGSAALWHYRAAYRRFYVRSSWSAVLIGIGVFAVWLALEPSSPDAGAPLREGVSAMGVFAAGAWLVLRLFGSVVVNPIVEELAFRGYLIRRFTTADFESVLFTSITFLPALLSSIAFGLLHGRWLAGTLAGLAYAWALHRRGELSDAIVAHATTNALIAIAVLGAGAWGLWM